MRSKKIKLSPKEVKAYEKMSGFKTTGEVYIEVADDTAWKIMADAIYGPKPPDYGVAVEDKP